MQPSASSLLLTETAYASHEAELRRLRTARDSEIPGRLREARASGGTDAVDEIGYIHDERAILDAQISRLERLLGDATVIADGQAGGLVCLGSMVEVQYAGTSRTATYRITAAGSTAGGGAVSSRSPVGSALIGRRPGETVAVELPRGGRQELTVVAILPG